MGGRGSKGGFITVGGIKMRAGNIEKAMAAGTVETEAGYVFTYDGEKYGVIGNNDRGYAVTHISTGLLMGGYQDTIQDAIKNISDISKTVHGLRPEYLQSLVDQFNAAKSRKA